MKQVWVVVQHCDDWDVIGVYDNKAAAIAAVDLRPDYRWAEEKNVLDTQGVEATGHL